MWDTLFLFGQVTLGRGGTDFARFARLAGVGKWASHQLALPVTVIG